MKDIFKKNNILEKSTQAQNVAIPYVKISSGSNSNNTYQQNAVIGAKRLENSMHVILKFLQDRRSNSLEPLSFGMLYLTRSNSATDRADTQVCPYMTGLNSKGTSA